MAKQTKNLRGKVAAITGGGRGIGRATAQAFIREGMKVAIGDLDEDLAKRTAEELGSGTVGLPLDVTNRDSFAEFLDAVDEQVGPLDVLVNNAGIMQIGPFLAEDDLTAHRMVDLNIHGVLYGCKLALPRFLERGSGHLVNIASSAGKGGFPGGATYCGTKHFVVGMSEAIRGELRDTNIEVACVMPGVVNTELATGLQQARGVKTVQPEDVAAEIVDALKTGRFDVFVPRSIGSITKVMNVMPRGVREGIARGLKADRILLEASEGQKRVEYDRRASHSVPALEAIDESKLLEQKTAEELGEKSKA
jgi:NADP-dependent 3-hydroxy acid dehydrogenase YdfG